MLLQVGSFSADMGFLPDLKLALKDWIVMAGTAVTWSCRHNQLLSQHSHKTLSTTHAH
jgi:hypothetical protein